MAASERLSLLLEARTSGEQDLARLERQVNQVIAAASKTPQSNGFDAVQKSAQKAQESTESFGDNLQQFVSDPLGTATGKLSEFARGMGTFGSIVAAGATVAIAAGTAMVSLAKNFDDAGEAAINMSERTGLSYKEVGLFTKAADLAGVSADGLTTSIKGMANVLLDAGQEGQKLRKNLADLGANFKNDFGGVKSTKDLFLEIAKALQGIEDPARRADTAIKALGKPGLELLPLLRSNLSETLRELESFGVGLSDVQVRKADEYGAALDRLSVQLSVLKKRLSEFSADNLKGPVQILGFLASAVNGKPDFKALGLNIDPSRTPRDFANQPIALPPGQTADGSDATLNSSDLALARSVGIPKAPSVADLEATLTQSRRNQIRSFLLGRRSVENEISELESQLREQESDADLQGVQETVVKIAAARARKVAEEKAKEFQKKLNGFTLEFAKAVIDPNGNLKPLQNRQFQPFEIRALEEFQAFNSPVDPNSIPQSTRSTLPTNIGTFGANRFGVFQDQRIIATRQDLDYQRAKIELLTGPGGELAAIQRIAQLKFDALEREKELGADAFDIEQQRRQIAIDTELQIISIRRNALNVGKDQLFGLATGQTSVGQFASNTALTIGRNAFGRVYDGVIGPSLGRFGAASGLGQLLSGTAFDPAQRVGVDGNTRATDENTAALRALTGVIGGGVFPGGGTADIPAIFGGGASRGGFGSIFSLLGLGKKSSTTAYTETGGEGDELASLQSISGGGRALRNVGIAAAGVGGAFGVYSGIRTGGARGATAAIGSGAGATAAILSLAGVSGPAAPILAGIALGAEVIRSMLPDPKAARDRRINSILDGAVYNGPMSSAYSEDIYGQSAYYNKRGEMTVIVNQNVQAWDPSSFVDHRGNMADAIRQAIQEAHPINFEIQQLSTAY